MLKAVVVGDSFLLVEQAVVSGAIFKYIVTIKRKTSLKNKNLQWNEGLPMVIDADDSVLASE